MNVKISTEGDLAHILQQLVGGPQEHLEDKTNLGAFRGVATSGEGEPIYLGKLLMRGGTRGGNFWITDLGDDGSNVTRTQGCTCGFPSEGDGEEDVKAR